MVQSHRTPGTRYMITLFLRTHYLRCLRLVKHIFVKVMVASTADDINITALDAALGVDVARRAVTKITVKNIFRSAGFEKRSPIDSVDISSTEKRI